MSGPGQSVLRHAVEALLHAQAELPRSIDAMSRTARNRITEVAEATRSARHRLAAATPDDIAALAPAADLAMTELSASTRQILAHEVHALLDLLAVRHHRLEPLPPLDLGDLGVPDPLSAEVFPEGFARSYVETVLGDLEAGRVTSKAEAAAHPGADQAAIDAALERIVDAVAPEHREQVRRWLAHPDCHAVEVHGPQVGDRELELRAAWTRPPDHGTEGADTWRVRDDQKVVSKHQVGIEATRFNTPEAFARPLDVFLDVASQHPGGIEGFLDQHFPAGIAPIFVAADHAGLVPGDASGSRGAGTGIPEAAGDWLKMRNAAMKNDSACLPPVHTVPYDPFQDGPEAGVRLIFKKRGAWSMTTYYPTGEPAYDNVRLEELT